MHYLFLAFYRFYKWIVSLFTKVPSIVKEAEQVVINDVKKFVIVNPAHPEQSYEKEDNNGRT